MFPLVLSAGPQISVKTVATVMFSQSKEKEPPWNELKFLWVPTSAEPFYTSACCYCKKRSGSGLGSELTTVWTDVIKAALVHHPTPTGPPRKIHFSILSKRIVTRTEWDTRACTRRSLTSSAFTVSHHLSSHPPYLSSCLKIKRAMSEG